MASRRISIAINAVEASRLTDAVTNLPPEGVTANFKRHLHPALIECPSFHNFIPKQSTLQGTRL